MTMAHKQNVERLTPLDLLMPRTYISVLLTFSTAEDSSSIISRLQGGLDILARQVPWLSGRVLPATEGPRQSLEVRWSDNDEPLKLVDKGHIPVPYQTLRKEAMPPEAILEDVWPTPGMIDDLLFEKGAPIFGASLFGFSGDQGVGVCICIHYNTVDVTGLTEIVKLWTQNLAETEPSFISIPQRLRLASALSPDLRVLMTESHDGLFDLHPEYSRTPSAIPTEFPPCLSKIFKIPVTRIDSIKDSFRSCMPTTPTTNTMVCALMWSAITHARVQRNSALLNGASRLAMAVNGRRRISDQFATPDNSYLGNVVLCSLAELSIDELDMASSPGRAQPLAELCDRIAESQSSERINTRHVAEVYSLVDRMDDYRKLFFGFDLFNGSDLMITSWADVGLYGLDFEPGLGKADFMRVPHVSVDGICLVLPRKRMETAVGASDEMLKVMIMLRSDDMDTLENGDLWASIVRSDQ